MNHASSRAASEVISVNFERVLVPLDGSRLSEASLPTAKALARRLGSMLMLVHVVEEDPPEEVHGDVHLTSSSAAQAYLERHRNLCAQEGLNAEVHVTTPQDDDVAQAIVALAEQYHADLIAMCAHGRQTLKDRLLGPIAQRALRGGGPPIMLRTAGSSADPPGDIRHILMPVDFRHDLEVALEDLAILAAGFDADVTLLHAVDARSTGLPARMLPNTSLELSDQARDAAREHLSELTEQLHARSIRAEGIVTTKDPEDAIVDEARARKIDLIILVSHGRSGVSAWYERSVGREIIRESALNLLLIRDPQGP